jgi:class 3 adenylate cyclase
MFGRFGGRMLVSMSGIDAAPLNWSDLGVGELMPTGTVTLLLADVEGSTRLWKAQPEETRRGQLHRPTNNRAARLRDLAHRGQTVLSNTTSDLVADRLPPIRG